MVDGTVHHRGAVHSTLSLSTPLDDQTETLHRIVMHLTPTQTGLVHTRAARLRRAIPWSLVSHALLTHGYIRTEREVRSHWTVIQREIVTSQNLLRCLHMARGKLHARSQLVSLRRAAIATEESLALELKQLCAKFEIQYCRPMRFALKSG
eukprot:656132_1